MLAHFPLPLSFLWYLLRRQQQREFIWGMDFLFFGGAGLAVCCGNAEPFGNDCIVQSPHIGQLAQSECKQLFPANPQDG